MALVGNISGSIQNSSNIGISGSIVVANRPDALFPTLGSIGNNVSFFVSGSKGSLGAVGSDNAVFGGNLVVSGTMKVGSGFEIAEVPGVITYLDSKTFLNLAAAGGGVDINDGGLIRLLSPSGVRIGPSFSTVTVGDDTILFVSGAIGSKGTSTKGTSVFGGDAVVSGSLTIGTGSVIITSNDITFAGGITQILSGAGGLTFKDSSGTVTLSDIIAGAVVQPAYWQSNTAGEVFTTGSAVTSGSITVKDGSGNSVFGVNGTTGNVSGSGNFSVGGNITIAGNIDTDTAESKTLFASAGANNITVGGGSSTVIIPGNLTVQGTTTTVETTNLVVKDPLIYMASASAAGTVAYGGIAIASGSGVADQALVFVKDGTGTNTFWSSGRQDVVSGTRTDSTGLIYLPVRASKFELGGTVGGANNAFLTSSDGASVVLSGSGVVTIGSNALQAVDIQFGGSQFATIAPVGTSVKLGASAGNNLTLSGSRVIAQTSPGTAGGVLIQTHTTDFVTIVSGTAPNSIAVRGEQAGNSLDLFNTNSTTINFGGAATSITMGATAGSSTVRNKFVRFGDLTRASWTTSGISSDFAASTYTDNSTPAAGTVASRTAVSVNRPTYASTNAITVTDAANLYVNNAPAAGTNTTIGNSWALWVDDGESRFDGNILPGTDLGANLGSPAKRWGNIYTGDLHLRNDRGDYTLIEEEDFLSIRFNKTGKRYKFVLEPVPELDEK